MGFCPTFSSYFLSLFSSPATTTATTGPTHHRRWPSSTSNLTTVSLSSNHHIAISHIFSHRHHYYRHRLNPHISQPSSSSQPSDLTSDFTIAIVVVLWPTLSLFSIPTNAYHTVLTTAESKPLLFHRLHSSITTTTTFWFIFFPDICRWWSYLRRQRLDPHQKKEKRVRRRWWHVRRRPRSGGLIGEERVDREKEEIGIWRERKRKRKKKKPHRMVQHKRVSMYNYS